MGVVIGSAPSLFTASESGLVCSVNRLGFAEYSTTVGQGVSIKAFWKLASDSRRASRGNESQAESETSSQRGAGTWPYLFSCNLERATGSLAQLVLQ